ncbi:uncharacterized protein MYCFIDRAFT_196111 [Pseudocercospora fijiensis CIRAD86]|uniref:Uncharacterized protein n=1 Tax=Pseudocercospora fijiensis (strain CIRAD86) TaxID=383855 RepID=M2YY44_PSEFD|nr:uncharacterized protein MYCFIDRAFT_196111 [Pseudocercospora fijiensis CIRAD86]EME82590.1 hypothetical protein MYCFIDRAFT_196111 [Pseudocercospora fijiensis CIRAD86]
MADVETRAKLKSQFLDRPSDQHIERWDDLWKQGVTPWDRNGPSVALKDAITGHEDLFGSPVAGGGRKRALVPGCGRGYDVLLLAALGYDTYGVDGSETAVGEARKLQAMSVDDDIYAVHDAEVGRGESRFILGDFFNDDFLESTKGAEFDVVFDYTFLCALPPEMRPQWARRMRDLLSPSGHLVCLQWPLGKDPKEGGPPHALTNDLYVELFKSPGEDVEYGEDGKAKETDREVGPSGLVRVKHYRPERTHPAGQTSDYVSIWKRQ